MTLPTIEACSHRGSLSPPFHRSKASQSRLLSKRNDATLPKNVYPGYSVPDERTSEATRSSASESAESSALSHRSSTDVFRSAHSTRAARNLLSSIRLLYLMMTLPIPPDHRSSVILYCARNKDKALSTRAYTKRYQVIDV
jgi:hypothetical protein